MRRTILAAGLAGLIGVGTVGAADKVAPFVTTPWPVVDVILEMADLQEGETIYDLGSGDGRIVLAAVGRYPGVSGVGIEIDENLVALSRRLAQEQGVEERATFLAQDLFETPLHGVDVVTLYLMPEANLRLRPKLFKELRSGARVISHDFSMGEWEPEEIRDLRLEESDGIKDQHLVYFWVIPGNASGSWQWRAQWHGEAQPWELNFEQEFQNVSGTLRIGEKTWELDDAGVRGNQLWASVRADFGGGVQLLYFSGTLEHEVVEGILELGYEEEVRPVKWKAHRTGGRQSSVHPAETSQAD